MHTPSHLAHSPPLAVFHKTVPALLRTYTGLTYWNSDSLFLFGAEKPKKGGGSSKEEEDGDVDGDKWAEEKNKDRKG